MFNQQQIAEKKRYAGEKKESMKRRDDHNDYHGRRMYMITMEVEGRHPLFGRVTGNPFAPAGSTERPHMELSPLGAAVQAEWQGIPRYYPQIEIMAIQMMPDHLHGILFVHDTLPVHLGQVMAGFKKGCERKWKALSETAAAQPQTAAVQPQPTPNNPVPSSLPPQPAAPPPSGFPPSVSLQPAAPPPSGSSPSVLPQAAVLPQRPPSSRLFALGYNDLLLKTYDEFMNWKRYLADNPFRLAMKRARPELLRVKLGVNVCGTICSAVGNLALLSAPQKLLVRISRSIAPALLEQEKAQLLAAARAGAVLVSPAISPGEKAITRAAFDEGLPLIVLLDNGLDPMSKPSGERFRACAEGRLLLLSPFPHRNNRVTITRTVCEALNGLAWEISGGK